MKRTAQDATVILDHLRRLVRVLRDSSRFSERTLGVTGAQLFALKALAAEPALSLNELARRTRTHQSTVSVVVKRLVTAKLVSRGTSEEDGRRVELAVTAKGRALLAKAPLAAQERLIQGVVRLRESERAELAESLHRLVAAMDLGDETPAMFFEEEDTTLRRIGQRHRA
jgi:DNA-binding MarR family transcriptional regulator